VTELDGASCCSGKAPIPQAAARLRELKVKNEKLKTQRFLIFNF
jgi:hypothetical protein